MLTRTARVMCWYPDADPPPPARAQLKSDSRLADETSRRPLFFGPGVAFEFPCEVTGA